MTGLNENQVARLRVTFRHVDELLVETLRILGASERDSPFARYIQDATPVQQKVISDYAARVRAAMRAVLEARKIDLPRPEISAMRAARAFLTSASIAVEELGPNHMRGYGELSEEAAKDLNGVVSQLLDLLDQMASYLAQGSSRDLRARLKQLEQTTPEVSLARELERIIASHGLVELRATLEALIERLHSDSFEVAVFGRVSCGKSSLLNYILKTDVLPVGVTPVTTVPVRITYGAEAWGRVWFADAAPQIFDLGRLPEFATEHFNPSNMRHVTRITVELPAPLLKDGVTFVDTPGLGSLATGSAAESLAYLPRCDLGIVLIDAASTLSAEDVALVDTLHRAGANVMVLLSKADLLTAQDRALADTYVGQQLESQTGVEVVPVYLVSVKGTATALGDRWLEKTLLPRLRDHRRLTQMSLRRKLGMLQDTVTAALEKRLSRSPKPTDGSGRADDAERILSQALAQLDEARRRRPDGTAELGKLAGEILDETAHNAAVIWNQHHEPVTEITTLLSASLNSRAGQAAGITARSLIKIRAVLQNALANAVTAAGVLQIDEEDLPRPAGMPSLDGAALIPQTILRKPALAFLGTVVLRYSARKQLADGPLQQDIGDALMQYEKRLENWRLQMLDDLRQSFIARSDLIRAQFDNRTGLPLRQTAGYMTRVRDDLERLRRLGNSNSAEPFSYLLREEDCHEIDARS